MPTGKANYIYFLFSQLISSELYFLCLNRATLWGVSHLPNFSVFNSFFQLILTYFKKYIKLLKSRYGSRKTLGLITQWDQLGTWGQPISLALPLPDSVTYPSIWPQGIWQQNSFPDPSWYLHISVWNSVERT
jgi:hypothetical protein